MTLRWRAAAEAAGLVSPDGSTRPTIFAEMTALALRTGAANLGQGFPDADGPQWIREAAVRAIREGANQYAPGRGIPELRSAVAEHQRRHYGLDPDPEREVLVTAGATEGIAAAVLALTGPGDEVVTLEPFYDSYAAVIAMAGATHVTVPLVADAGGFRVDAAALESAVGPRTRLILVNSPHNPTGTVLSPEELGAIASAARRVDAVVVTDEVYEHLTFDGLSHTPLATLPGMAERTLSVSSAGKTFSLTGWKIGWVTGPADLIEAVLAVKQFLTYTGGAPFQPAIARALLEGGRDIAELRDSLAERRDLLLDGLRAAGFDAVSPGGTYFVCADASPFLTPEAPHGAAFARALPERSGVACVPVSAFCREGSRAATALSSWVRFTFVKDEQTLRTAIERLAAPGRR
ncbi:pyridoxal phosphate-dependent aminotransferase [Leucobacter sp. wl10]|uniref:pyridoxal phosphate-dependent aminotransferase n=1 Tax=Leucobacter sp. wl10 TaxID=2304677 RepID=UPI000E5AD5C8|nr:pyridoxal phosphate-dependent aminotransferase [Leucobacter sp. wl10]RGE24180.1 putative succinyldiaminopimelate transaminase DapC [Leucobacter sp. wl10]